MGFSISTLLLVFLCLLAALVVLVSLQVLAGRANTGSPTVAGRFRPEIVWASCLAAFAGFVAGLLAWLPLALTVGSFDSVPEAVTVPWMLMWGLGPCVILGYLSGRWWSFVGALPLLLLWPLGVMFESTDASVDADLFSTLPLTAALAVALSLGSGVRTWQDRRGPVPTDRPAPVAEGIGPNSPVIEPPLDSQPPYWPPPPGWKPTPSREERRKRTALAGKTR